MLTQLRELIRYREAIRNFVARDLKVRYSNSALGVIWSLFNPLLMTLVFTLVFSYVVPNRGIEKYPVFFLAGLLPWNFFSVSLVGTVHSVSGSGHLVSRVYFPREILPISIVLSNALHFLIALAPFTAIALLYQVRFSLAVLWLPVLVAVQIAFSVGLGMFLSAVNVFFRDTQQIVEILVLPWFFLTPIIYDVADPAVRAFLALVNPVAGLVFGYRQVLYAGAPPDLTLLAVTVLEAALLLLVGSVTFQRLSPAFAEEI